MDRLFELNSNGNFSQLWKPHVAAAKSVCETYADQEAPTAA